MKIILFSAIISTLAMSNVESLSLRGGGVSLGNNDEANILDAEASSDHHRPQQDGDGRELNWISDCATVEYWHPVYTAGWEGGYCTQSTGCNAPSYLSAADCCNTAYLGQSTGACNAAAGIAISPPAPSPGGATWYPDYNADWQVGKCIDTLPLPPYGSRPLYDSQLECCKQAYAGQTNNYCIQNMANPPTSSPSTSPTSRPTSTPTTDRPTSNPTEAPTGSPSASPTNRPTSVPSVSPTSKPTATPTERPTKVPTSEPTTKSPTTSPTTAGPTVTQFGSLWYPNYSLGYCQNKLPLPVNGAAPTSPSKEACCAGNYSHKFAECISN